MKNLKVTIIQYDIFWEDKNRNLGFIDGQLSKLNEGTDLIVLPETFSTGFSMNASEIYEEMNGKVISWMKEKSSEYRADITGSIIIKENEKYYNRLIWVKPGGDVLFYDKKYLFSMSGEDKVFVRGSEQLTVEVKGWKVRPFICYDLRFPEWLRNHYDEYDLALVMANWPDKRADHWKTLLRARAIENQSYVVGVNCIGEDGNGIRYTGDSTIIDFYGEILFAAQDNEIIHTLTLTKKDLENYREAFPVWKDVDQSKSK